MQSFNVKRSLGCFTSALDRTKAVPHRSKSHFSICPPSWLFPTTCTDCAVGTLTLEILLRNSTSQQQCLRMCGEEAVVAADVAAGDTVQPESHHSLQTSCLSCAPRFRCDSSPSQSLKFIGHASRLQVRASARHQLDVVRLKRP